MVTFRHLSGFVFAAASVIACGDTSSKSEGPPCAEGALENCPRPSVEDRSVSWPENRQRLAELVASTSAAVTTPESWRSVTMISRPDSSVVFAKWTSWPVWAHEKEGRYRLCFDTDSAMRLFGNGLSNLALSRSSFNVSAAARAASKARSAFGAIRHSDLFRDPFGEPEPRTALFTYARAVTVELFLSKPAERSPLIEEAQSLLESHLEIWAEMQRKRLSGKPDSEVQNAVDEMGGPELKNLFAAWQAMIDVKIPPIADE